MRGANSFAEYLPGPRYEQLITSATRIPKVARGLATRSVEISRRRLFGRPAKRTWFGLNDTGGGDIAAASGLHCTQ